jgi:hypothetical protein
MSGKSTSTTDASVMSSQLADLLEGYHDEIVASG